VTTQRAATDVGAGSFSAATARTRAARHLLRVAPLLTEVGELFASAGHELAVVGGWVRDALLDRPDEDLDFATSARPEQTTALLAGWADAIWTVGQAYGTIAARKDGHILEITTYRSERYDPSSRKPDVAYGDSLEGDLRRRDFTVNAMAVRVPQPVFVDPFGGVDDLAAGVLRTPGTPEESFSDDPLRMMRAARFAAQLGFTVDPAVQAAMASMADRIGIVSAERVREELSRLLLAGAPRRGLGLLVQSGLADHVVPELPALRLEIDEHHRHKDVYEHSLTVLDQAIALEPRLPDGGPDLVVRLAALLHDIGKPRTRRFEPGGGVSFHHHEVVGARMVRRRLGALRYPNHVVDDVARLTELHLRFHGYTDGEWTDSAVRRYVRDAGPLLARLHVLTRADCTTRNRRKALALQQAYDHLERRIDELAEQEELAAIRPDLDGTRIMQILGVPPGPLVGRAYRHLLEVRMDVGPLGPDEAREALLAWWAEQPEAQTGSGSAR
jgi:poly(A) polymerase